MASVGHTSVVGTTREELDTAVIAKFAALSITALSAATIINIVQDAGGSYTAFIAYSIA